jgi:hypothetical protein
MTMPEGRYVAKPQTVSAIQWTGDNAAEVKAWAGEIPDFDEAQRRAAFLVPEEMFGVNEHARWWFWSTNRYVPAPVESWLVRGDDLGNEQILLPEVFAARYDQATDPNPEPVPEPEPVPASADEFAVTWGHTYLHRSGRSEHDAHQGTCADYEEALRAVCLARLGRTPGVIVDQPPSVPNDGPAPWDLVLADMRERHQVGVQRYGTALQAVNGRDMLVDAYQKILDLAVYLRGEIQERRTAGPRRGDATEAWLKGFSDLYQFDDGPWSRCLGLLLDDYRSHADANAPLDQSVKASGEDKGPGWSEDR